MKIDLPTASTENLTDSLNKRFVTDANLTTIGNQSSTNTGDNATNTQYSGLAASKQDTITVSITAPVAPVLYQLWYDIN